MPEGLDSKSDLIEEASYDNGVLRAKVAGEVNLHNSPKLREHLLRLAKTHEPERAELDLGEVPYMDSSAIAVLVELLKAVRNGRKSGEGESGEAERRVRLLNLRPRVSGLLHIARLDAIFDIEEAKDDAQGADKSGTAEAPPENA